MIIWLSSYPRSGNTFIRTLIKNCLGYDTYSIYNDNEIGGDPGLTKITGHKTLEHVYGTPGFDLSPMRDSESLFFVKTHEPNRLLVESDDKVIYIIRDGREATLSFHKYLQDFYDKEITPLELTFGLDFPGGAWSEHVKGWSLDDEEDTLLLRFEDVTSDPKNAVDQIAEFADIESVTYSIPEFRDLQEINSKFFRKGKNDSFKSEVSRETQILFWLSSYSEMRDYGYLNSLPDFVGEIDEKDLLAAEAAIRRGFQYARCFQSRLKSQYNNSSAHILELRNEISNLYKSIEDKDKLSDELKESISQERTLREKINNLYDIIVRQDSQMRDLEQDAKRKGCQVAEQRASIIEKDLKIGKQSDSIEHLNLQIEKQRESIDAKDKLVEKLQEELDKKSIALDFMHHSWSWRLTAPLRMLNYFLNGSSRYRESEYRSTRGKKG